jgi:hypothetical protein
MLSPRKFALRLLHHGGVVLAAVIVALLIGVVGYHLSAGLSWIDSLLNASMILSGMGPTNPLTTTIGKLFASFYALFSGLFFIVVTGVMLSPFVHRVLHRFHLEKEKDK